MSRVTFIAGNSQDASNVAANPARMVNCYIEGLKQGSKSVYTIRPVPGQAAFADLGTPLLREMREVNGTLYAVANGALYSVQSDGQHTQLGAIADDEVTTISGNKDSVVVTANNTLHVWDGGAVSEPTGGAFVAVGSAEFFDFYTVMSESNGSRFQWTATAAPETLNGLYFADAESSSDSILRVQADDNLWLFGERTTEVWVNSGQSGANAFTSRIASFKVGLQTARSVVKMTSGFFFVGHDGVPYITNGLTPQPLVHPGVETAIREKTIDRCMYYEVGHHKMAVIRFTDAPAWVFDVATGEWHERATGVNLAPWEVVSTAFAYGKWYAATNGGKIYEMARTATDIDYPLKRQITALPLTMGGDPFTVDRLELIGEYGASSLGRVATVFLEKSRDGGKTWADPSERSIGDIADYSTRAVWRALGYAENQMTFRFSMTDPVDMPLLSDGNIEIG